MLVFLFDCKVACRSFVFILGATCWFASPRWGDRALHPDWGFVIGCSSLCTHQSPLQAKWCWTPSCGLLAGLSSSHLMLHWTSLPAATHSLLQLPLRILPPSRLSARRLWLEWIWLYHLKFITSSAASSNLVQKQSYKDLFVAAPSPPQE